MDQETSGITGAQLVHPDQPNEIQDASETHQESTQDKFMRRSYRSRVRTRDTLHKDFVCD